MERLITPGGVLVEASDEAVELLLANGYRRVEPAPKPKPRPRAGRKPKPKTKDTQDR